jgi:hypothetical protein
MANQILIPYLNPVKFVEFNRSQPAQYESRHLDDYLFADQLRSYQTRVEYKQKWTVNDAIKLQFESNFDPIQVQIIDCQMNVYRTQNATRIRTNKYVTGFYVYEVTTSLALIDPGVYFLLLTLGGSTQMISEPFQVSATLPESLLFEYNNTHFHGDVLFETGFTPSLRVEAILDDEPPANERTGYIDQKFNATVLKSVPYRVFTLTAGHREGVPSWVAHKLNWIFSCNNVMIDGKPYAVFDANIEGNQLDPQYPMRPYSVKLREGVNSSSKAVGVTLDANKKMVVSLVLDSTVFGDLSEQAGNNLITITSVE